MHLLVYIKRRVGDGQGVPLANTDVATAALKHPVRHGFGQTWLYQKALSGQPMVIWLFSVLRHDGWCLPPSLDARIVIGKAHKKPLTDPLSSYEKWFFGDFSYAVDAMMPGSCYLPWNDFGPTLNAVLDQPNLPCLASEVQVFTAYAPGLRHFQTPRIVPARKAAYLEAHVRGVATMPTGFISYRRKEAPLLAMQAAALMARHKFAPWFDQWAMPRKVAEEINLCAQEVMTTSLDAAIQSAKLAVTLHTDSYASPKAEWTRRELTHIRFASQNGALVHCPITPLDAGLRDPQAAKCTVEAVLPGAIAEVFARLALTPVPPAHASSRSCGCAPG
ncbi:MAG: hypothetical protein FD135_575 [Comamonadaceae bacterium]|nr:MAG: hypothetical protein FD135_575 [Comamonadaceae bacterium]